MSNKITNFKEFLRSHRVLDTNQYEGQFGVNLYTEGKKVSVYGNGYYIIHTEDKFLLELERDSFLFDNKEDAEDKLWNDFVIREENIKL